MSFFNIFSKKSTKKTAQTVGTLIGNNASVNAQNATNAAVDGMSLFQWKMNTSIIRNGSFDQQKGNLFEYIEAAKFNTDAAAKGLSAKAIVTDTYDPGAAADILIKDGGKIQKEVQAKFIQSSSANGQDTSAAKSVFDQAGGQKNHWGKYNGMDRLIRKQEDYNEQGSLLDEAKRLAQKRSESNSLHASEYGDVYEHLTDELQYKDASSGGTTIEEVRDAYDNSNKYAKNFEHKQVMSEMKCSAANMAKASFVSTGIVSGVSNMFAVFQDKKELADALVDVGVDAVKGAVRGGATGVISTAIRYEGIKKGSALLSDSTAATVMAGGIIDGGVALYSYAKGEIGVEELRNQLIDTTAKSAATIYFTKAVGMVLGKSASPILPMAIYTTASYVVTCTREILRNAKLKTEEYERMTAILQESTRQANEYHEEFKKHVARCEERQRQMLDRFINTFEYNMETGENYDQALYAIVRFADEAGIALQHVKFEDFQVAMRSKDPFVLG